MDDFEITRLDEGGGLENVVPALPSAHVVSSSDGNLIYNGRGFIKDRDIHSLIEHLAGQFAGQAVADIRSFVQNLTNDLVTAGNLQGWQRDILIYLGDTDIRGIVPIAASPTPSAAADEGGSVASNDEDAETFAESGGSGAATGSVGGNTHAAPVLDFDSAASFAAVLVAGIVLGDAIDHS